MEVVILTVVLILCTLVWYRSRRPLNYPPGPTPWPVIGNISTMADPDILKVMKNIRGAYGDIFTLSIGCYWVIVANGTKTIHELLVKNADYTSDRPDMLLFRMLKNKGITSTNGATWKHQRAFTHSKLRLFGFGKVSFEEKITEELACFLNFMESNLEITDFSNELFASIVNNILSITIGRRLEYDDSRLLDIIERNNDNAKNFAVSGLGNFIPFLARIPGDPLKINRFQQNTDFCKDFFMEEVSEHKKQFDKNDKRDFIDVYLDEIDQHKKSENPYDENHLTAILFELFGAGGETTVSTIKWAILYMINNPEIQTKMRKEISDVVGLNRLPRLADRSEMHYSEAVILETLRISTMSVLSIPHSISETFEFRGFTLPKNAVLLLNYDSVAFDEDLFPDSHVFRPERFIGSDGKVKGQEDVPVFSTGRRKCPGETLARMSLFLYLTSMLQRFEFIPVDVNKPPSLKSQYGISNSPVDFQCRMNVIDNQTNVGK